MKSAHLAFLFPSTHKKGFTLVELLVVVVIMGILSVGAYVGIQRSTDRNMNAKVLSDLIAIQNALDQFKKDNNGLYPMPKVEQGNALCFAKNTAYLHDCEQAFFIQTGLSEQLLSKRYLPHLPSDPRTGAPYAYGVSAEGDSAQVAGNYWDEEEKRWMAKLEGRLANDFPLRSLIRSYDGADFVVHNQVYLPYHPERFQISAQLRQVGLGVVVLNASGEKVDIKERVHEGYTIKVPKGERATVYFTDGSVSVLGSDISPSELTILPISRQEKDKEGMINKVFLKLSDGRVFTKVARITQAAEFNIQTTSAIAGVRGTEFGMETGSALGGKDRVYLYSGELSVRQKTKEELAQEFVEVSKEALDEPVWILSSDSTLVVVEVVNNGVNPLDNQPLESFQTLNLPAAQTQALMQEYFSQTLLNNNIRPTLLNIKAPELSFTLKALKDLNEGQAESLQATIVFACEAEIAELCEAQGAEACSVEPLCAEFVLPAAQNAEHLVNNAFPILLDHSPVRFAFANEEGSELQLSGFSLPAVFFDELTQLSSSQIELYETEWILIDNTPEKDLQATCEMSAGYWFQNACWILGPPNESCSSACETFGSESNMPGLACDEGEWNDMQSCDVCRGLVGEENTNTCAPSVNIYSPFFVSGFSACRYLNNFSETTCDSDSKNDDGTQHRICKCI